MTKRALSIFIAAWCILASGQACREQQAAPPPPAAKKQEHTFSVKGSVREMMIWTEPVDFPEHEGKAEFMSYCSMCHSLRYVTIQPDFPRTVWEAEVDKMVNKYKAPIDSAISKKIVDYLVAIKS